jgi:adenosyl cobinamide kinase/adenosyl cobinamide phosphate guanylyltransferase
VIVLVIGGTRSGKSDVAERATTALARSSGTSVTYIATGAATDPDMAARIDAHRARRPDGWHTVDRPDDVVATLRALPGTVLLDSTGTLVASTEGFGVDTAALCDAIARRSGDTIVVGEEVGLSVHATTDAGRRFTDAVGVLNRAIATIADRVLFVVAGRVVPLDDVETVIDGLR